MNKSTSRPSLCVSGIAPDGEALRPGYAYLIRSKVRMTELYPLLGEILFGSEIIYPENKDTSHEVPNKIGFFIEDTLDNLVNHLDKPYRYRDNQKLTFTESFLNDNDNNRMTPGFGAWLDTYGEFKDGQDKLKAIETNHENATWWKQSIPGAGNPMAIMRFFRLVQEEKGHSSLNIFLLNSLSSLYRNMGLLESAAFLKTILNDTIWSGATAQNGDEIRFKEGIFFAVMQEGVLEEKEASYLESFFDGIISVVPKTVKEMHVACVSVKVLPELFQLPKEFVYMPRWVTNDDNVQVLEERGASIDTKYIIIDDNIDCEEEKDKETKKDGTGSE